MGETEQELTDKRKRVVEQMCTADGSKLVGLYQLSRLRFSVLLIEFSSRFPYALQTVCVCVSICFPKSGCFRETLGISNA